MNAIGKGNVPNFINNTALQISIRQTELEAARLQGEYDVLNASHPYRGQ